MTAPYPSPAEQVVIDRSGIFAPEERWEQRVEAAARAIYEADHADCKFTGCAFEVSDPDNYRRLAAAALTADAALAGQRRAMLDLADNLDYYASKTTGGTHASGLSDAAVQLRDALGAAPQAEGQR